MAAIKPGDWGSQLLENRTNLRALEHLAANFVRAGNVELGLRTATAAADLCWFNHPGLYVSAILERVLIECGRLILGPSSTRLGTQSAGGSATFPRRVLHILTQAYPTGGHSRLAWRWMQRDHHRQHSVVLTLQDALPIPSELMEAASGRVQVLGDGSFVGRCQQLAGIIQEHDLVVLHVHPFDAVATATCAGLRGRPATIYVNHADHVFWLGVAAADAVLNLRPSGAALSRHRRGVSARRNLTLALPLDFPQGSVESEWRESLGIAVGDVVLLTVAQPYKYSSINEPSFPFLVDEALECVPRAHLIAVGPSSDISEWAQLEREHAGRVHLLGVVDDLAGLCEASDLYLDSFPCTSITSVLEATMAGIPALCYQQVPPSPLDFDDFFLHPRVATTRSEWLTAIEEWAEDPVSRRSAAAGMQAQSLQGHASPDWDNALASVYANVRTGAADLPESPTAEIALADIRTVALHTAGGLARDVAGLLRMHGFQSQSDPAASAST